MFKKEINIREEIATVGLKYNKTGDITENDIRKEHKDEYGNILKLRGVYGR
jgi:hypothetical protein